MGETFTKRKHEKSAPMLPEIRNDLLGCWQLPLPARTGNTHLLISEYRQ